MLRLWVCIALLVLAVTLIAAEPRKSPNERFSTGKSPSNIDLHRLVDGRAKSLTRVTERPFVGDKVNAGLCRAPLPVEQPVMNPHLSHNIHVYVSPAAKETLVSGQGVYPVGTYLLKEKLPWPSAAELAKATNQPHPADPDAGRTPELFTGMLKREAGYNPDCGDWEFFVVSGDARQVLARGKIDSCVDCHKDYKATDFVTRAYLPATKADASK
ncbi:MAG: cytochrome P460 family protein [Pirellulales bacterium]